MLHRTVLVVVAVVFAAGAGTACQRKPKSLKLNENCVTLPDECAEGLECMGTGREERHGDVYSSKGYCVKKRVQPPAPRYVGPADMPP
jgi:hypothetical protein